MKSMTFRAVLLSATAVTAIAMPHAAFAADAAATADAAASANAAAAGDNASSADQSGQANDAQSLTSSDIIVIGSGSAQAAPITASLTTTQPQSVVTREYIDNAVATADFNALAALTPGVSLTGSGNGIGFSETKLQIRGFQDGEYNVTYDSIPFSDTNNPTHHSTAFFPSNTIETVIIDRGPGNASQLGQASYGGNINLYSRAVQDEMGGQLEAIAGNWNSFLFRGEYQTGRIASLGGAQFVFAGQYLESDGALTFSPVASWNLFAKGVIPLGDSNTLTILSTYNRNHYYQSDTAKGATCGSATRGITGFANAALDANGQALTQLTAENCAPTSLIGQFGYNYGLANDPTQNNYWLYNRTDKRTDFEIVRLQSTLAPGLTLDNRVYTYSYTNNTGSGNTGSVVSGFSGLGTPASPYVAVTVPGHVLGYDKLNAYRTWGYIGQANYEFSFGKIRAGGWYETASTDRHLFDLDLNTGLPSFNERFNNGNGTAAQLALPSIAIANIGYNQHSGWEQYQLFGEFEVRPFAGLAITPGVKYVHFTRSIDAVVNQTARTPNNSSATWTRTLPFLTANWQVQPNWSFYAQYAQGMYVPDLSSFYSPSGSAAQQANQAQTLAALQPQTTTNYQIGTVWHGRTFSVDVDAYSIVVDNKIAASTLATDPPNTLINIGRVRYRGVEGQLSATPVAGLTLFVNGSYNYAQSVTTGAQISRAPFSTAGAGMFYNHGGFRVSFTQKFTGPAYANEFNGNPTQRLYRIAPYSVGDFAISQEIGGNFRIGLNVSNVFNNRAITAISTSATGAPTITVNGVTYQNGYGQADGFNFLPPRSAQVDVRVRF